MEKGKSQFVGPEIQGKTLGVIGLGAVGVLVANAATNVGMDVIGYDPYISIDNAWHLSDSVHKAAKMEDLLSKADYITVHVPLMEQTRDYISSPEFGKMKDGVIILNFARGGIIRETSLFEALDSGKVAKYITDFPDARCLMHENVICIPHLGASTPESEENCAVMAANEIKHFLERGSIKNSVNMPNCLLGEPVHHRISVIHDNLPNMVSQMTSVLAKEGLNIEEMVNKSRGQIAYTVFDLNEKISEQAIDEIKAIGGVIKVREIA